MNEILDDQSRCDLIKYRIKRAHETMEGFRQDTATGRGLMCED